MGLDCQDPPGWFGTGTGGPLFCPGQTPNSSCDISATVQCDGSGEAERRTGGRDLPAAEGSSAEARQARAAALGVWRGPTTQGEAAALSVSRGPTTLANVRQEPQPQDVPDAGAGRPLWPLLLALGVPAAALGVTASHAWWRARLAGRNDGHL